MTQYAWPDDAPTGIYAEQLSDAVAAAGIEVRFIAGSGEYRPGARPRPEIPIQRLRHRQGRRGRLLSTALEYASVDRVFARYIREVVSPGDVVLITSAPPTTVFLHRQVRRRGAWGIYWLQDFYPQLVRGVWDPPAAVTRMLEAAWLRALGGWDDVIKSAANLAYQGKNAVVYRNWNTLDPGPALPAQPRTALYSGNLGYGHDVGAFIALCARLREEGFAITVRGDGPGMNRLPSWIRREAPFREPEDLIRSYWEAEVHLVAADPRLTGAIFPSKLWNSLAVGRPVRASGFAGPMGAELELVLACDFQRHLPALAEFVIGRCTREAVREPCKST